MSSGADPRVTQPEESEYTVYYNDECLNLTCEVGAIPAPYNVTWLLYNATDVLQQSDDVTGRSGGCDRRYSVTRYLSWASGASLDDRKMAAQHSLICLGDNIYGHKNKTITLSVQCKYKSHSILFKILYVLNIDDLT